jgi:transposase
MLARHRDKLRPLNPDTPETRALQLLTEDRRQLVNERTRYSNRLTANRKSYYPQVLHWFDDLYAPVTLDFLEQWPTLEETTESQTRCLEQVFSGAQLSRRQKSTTPSGHTYGGDGHH